MTELGVQNVAVDVSLPCEGAELAAGQQPVSAVGPHNKEWITAAASLWQDRGEASDIPGVSYESIRAQSSYKQLVSSRFP